MKLLFGHSDEIAAWVGEKLGIADFGRCQAIGVVDGEAIIAGLVYNNYQKTVPSIEMSVASTDPRWMTRGTLDAAFRYPFVALGVNRVQATIRLKNRRARRMVERLGFTYEGKGREGGPGGCDVVVYSMLARECRWLLPDERMAA